MPKAEAKYTIRAEDKTRQGLRSAEGRLQRFRRAVSGGLAGLARGAAGPIAAIGAALVGWAASIKNAAAQLDDMGKRARELQTTAEDIAELDFAADQLGVRAGGLERAAQRLDALLERARRGEATAVDIFDRLGIDPAKLADVTDATDRLAAFADQLATIDNLSERRALSREALGRGVGRAVLEGGAGIRSAAAEAEALGLTEGLSESSRNAEAFNDAFGRLTARANAFTRRLGAAVINFQPLTNAVNIVARAGTRPADPAARATPDITSARSVRVQERSNAILVDIRTELRRSSLGAYGD